MNVCIFYSYQDKDHLCHHIIGLAEIFYTLKFNTHKNETIVKKYNLYKDKIYVRIRPILENLQKILCVHLFRKVTRDRTCQFTLFFVPPRL